MEKITFAITPEDEALIKREATQKRMAVSTFCRVTILKSILKGENTNDA